MAVNVYSTGNQLSENYSRQDLVDWANSFLHLSFTKVENFCSGGVLCLLFSVHARLAGSNARRLGLPPVLRRCLPRWVRFFEPLCWV